MGSADKKTASTLARRTALGVTGLGAVWAGLFRLVPHWPNFTPVGGLGLFAGARLRLWQAFAVPLVVMALSDLLLWGVFDKKPFNPWVYACVAVNVLLGRWLLKKGRLWRVPVVSLIASLLFFVVTNFGVWVGADGLLYQRTLAGLGVCYADALPFAIGTVAGDLAYSALFFGLYVVIVAAIERRKASQPV